MSMMTSMAISKATQADLGISQSRALAFSNEQDAEKKEKELRKASEGFEAIFIQKMWEEMRASMPENTMHGSKEEKYWQSMYNQQLGEDMAANGGIGLADMMMEQLSKERIKSPSAQNVFTQRISMEVRPAPLLPDPTAPKLETKQAVNGSSQSSQVKTNNEDDIYQSMEGTGFGNGTIGASNIELKTAPVLDPILEASGDIGHSYYAEPFKEAIAQANVRIETNSVPQVSSVLRQTIDELGALTNPVKLEEPTIIRTTYISNLPASKRKNAILDKNGKISAKHIASLQPEKVPTPPMRLGNIDRTMPAANTQSYGVVQGQGMNPYPENLMAGYPNQLNTLGNQDNSKLKEAEQILNADADALAGIQTRYISNTMPKEIQSSLDMDRIISHLRKSNGAFPSNAEVQAELNSLLARGSNRNMYGTMLANSVQINSSNPYNSSFMGGARLASLDENLNVSASSRSARNLNNKGEIPVFRTMPSIDEALQAGSLIASLSPEEIRKAQLGISSTASDAIKSTVNNTVNNTVNATANGVIKSTSISIEKKEQEKQEKDDLAAKAMGGPQISQPSHALPGTKVSGLSPKMDIQSPLEAGEVSSGFGWRLDPFSKERAWHTGIDIQASAGSKVSVVHDGVVSFAGKDAELGNMLIVEHGNGMQSVYGHNAELLVEEGEKISAGTNIANVGMSGRAAGEHLHFEIRHNGLSINPAPYLSSNKA